MALEKHFIQEGVIRSAIENFLKEEVHRAGYSGITIQKTPLATRVILYVEKPPIVIGKRGRRIKEITSLLKEKYGVENPIIDVQKIDKPTLDPNIVARRIAIALERGMHRRRVIYKALRAVMGAGARGVEIVLSGKLVGKGGRSRTEKYLEGYMKKAGDSLKLVKIGRTQAYIKAGVIGVTVKIVMPDTVFPDQISVISREEMEEKTVEEEPKKEEKTKKKTKKKATKKKTAKKTAKKKAEAGKDGEKKAEEKAVKEEKPGKTQEEKPAEDKKAEEAAEKEAADKEKKDSEAGEKVEAPAEEKTGGKKQSPEEKGETPAKQAEEKADKKPADKEKDAEAEKEEKQDA